MRLHFLTVLLLGAVAHAAPRDGPVLGKREATARQVSSGTGTVATLTLFSRFSLPYHPISHGKVIEQTADPF